MIDALILKDKEIISGADLIPLLGPNASQPNLILSRLKRKGWLQRLTAGTYRIVPFGSVSSAPMPDDTWRIAAEIFSPCYIGGWTASEHWDLTEQIYHKTFVFTSQKQRTTEHCISGLLLKTKFIREKSIFGTQKIWSKNFPIQISDIHRTLIDILDDPLCGGGGRVLIDLAKQYAKKKEADPELLFQYALKADRGAVFKRLGILSEHIFRSSPMLISKIETKCRQGIIRFDPAGPNTGPIRSRWGIRLNIPTADVL